MKKTIKQQLKDFMAAGNPLCKGMADRITDTQSAQRRLQELAQETKLYTFMAKTKSGSSIKVFTTKKSIILPCKIDSGEWVLFALGVEPPNINNPNPRPYCFKSRPFKTKKEALAQIKVSNKD